MKRSPRLFLKDDKTGFNFLIDTGADVSVLPKRYFSSTLSPIDNLSAANNSTIGVYGEKVLTVSLNLRRDFTHKFLIADVSKPILGADFLTNFDLIVDLKNKRLMDTSTNLQISGIHQFDLTPTPRRYVYSVDRKYDDILKDFPDITSEPDYHAKQQHNTVHHINTNGPLPTARARRLDPVRLKAAQEEFDYMCKIGICRPSSSPCATPLHMAKKKEPDTWRPCGDYRLLNSVTVPDKYPVSFIHDFANIMHKKRILSKVDLVRSFHSIAVAPEDVYKTAVITPFGLFEFLRMPFGLRNASQTFQRFMNEILAPIKDFCFAYIDDIIIASENEEEHATHLRKLFEILSKNGLRIKASKCEFGVESLDFLGYHVSATGITPSSERVQVIDDLQSPKTIKEIQHFVGAINFYHRFIPGLSRILAPMTNHLAKFDSKRKRRKLVSKTKPNEPESLLDPIKDFFWPLDCEEAFNKAKSALRNVTLLTYPVENAPINVITDASETAIGAVLQQYSGGDWRPLAFYSKKLSATERKYPAFDRELLAVFLAIKQFRYHVEGRTFHILTDHKPLTTALSVKRDRNPRQENQLSFISEFTSDIRYVRGVDNVVADALSRISSIDFDCLDFAKLFKEQAADKTISDYISGLRHDSKIKIEKIQIPGTDFQILCETSAGINRPVIPTNLRHHLFEKFHGLSHPSAKATSKNIAKKYFWPTLNSDIGAWARVCEECQRNKVSRHTKPPTAQITIPPGRFMHIHLDLVGPLPSSQSNKYILTIIDRFSRWTEAIPLPDMTADTVAKAFVTNYVSRFGVPLEMSTDQGTQFESRLISGLNSLLGTSRIRTAAYNPQANGLIERFHRQLKSAIRCVGSMSNWSELLPLVMLGIRTTYREDLKSSPAEMLYGENPYIPGELFDPSPIDLSDPESFANKLREKFTQVRSVPTRTKSSEKIFVPSTLNNCTHVWLRIDRVRKPTEGPYEGPFKVLRRLRNNFIIQRNNDKTQTVSIRRLKPAFLSREIKTIVKPKKKKKVTFNLTPIVHYLE